ncbi:MAG: hypothetical protein H6740_00870 [Alphaproteobacteria bacterium]|nr:hypothetical protein [Alphaproteobacteria bacterium]
MARSPSKKSKKLKYDPRVVGALAAGVDTLDEVERYGEAAAWLAGKDLDLATLPPQLALSAIEAAVRTRNVARLQSLEGADKELRKLSRAGLHRLKASGVEVEPARAASTFTLGREEVTVPPRAFITHADEQGYSEFVLGVTDAEGSCVLMGWFGGAEGFRELSHGHVSRSSLRKLVREVDEQIAHMVEVPFTEALHHILPSVELATKLNGHAPHDWDHFATHLTEEWLSEAKAAAPLGKLPEHAEEGQLDATAALAQHPWFNTWPVSDGALNEAYGAFFGAMGAAADAAEAAEEPEEEEAQAKPVEGGAEPAEEGAEDSAVEESAQRAAMDEGLNKAAQRVLDDAGVREEWLRRARLAATLAKGSQDKELFETVRHLTVALEQGMGGDKLGLSTGVLQSRVIQQAISGMQSMGGLNGEPEWESMGGLNGEPEWE